MIEAVVGVVGISIISWAIYEIFKNIFVKVMVTKTMNMLEDSEENALKILRVIRVESIEKDEEYPDHLVAYS